MKKKPSTAASPSFQSAREKLRKQSAYSTPRAWASVTLVIMGVLQILGGVAFFMMMRFDFAFASLVFGVFSLLALAIIGAIFDMADAALAGRKDEEARIAREALAEARRREAAINAIERP